MKHRSRLIISLLVVIAVLVLAGITASNLHDSKDASADDAASAASPTKIHRSPNSPAQPTETAPDATTAAARPTISSSVNTALPPSNSTVLSQPNQRPGSTSQESNPSQPSKNTGTANTQSSNTSTNPSPQANSTSTSLVAFTTTAAATAQPGGAYGTGGQSASTSPGASQENAQPTPEPEVASTEPPELNIPVPPGAIAPAVFYDQEPRSPQQTKVLDRIAKEFQQDIAAPSGGLSTQEVWETARYIADWKYQTFFGYAAYNEKHLQSAKEAVKERRALQTTTPVPETSP